MLYIKILVILLLLICPSIVFAQSSCKIEFTPPPSTVFKGSVGTSFLQTIQIKAKTISPNSSVDVNFHIEITGLPAGLRQDTTFGSSVSILGTPTQAGSFNINVSASGQKCGDTSAPYVIEIEGQPCPQITFEPADSTITLTNGGSVEIVPLYDGQPREGGTLEVSVNPVGDFDIFRTEPGSRPGSVKVTLSLKGNPSQPTLTAKLTNGSCESSKTYNLNILPVGGGLELTNLLDFGSINPNTEATRILEATNVSNAPISITSADFMGAAGFFRLDGSIVGNLAPQTSTRMNVVFKPTTLGSATATLLVQTSVGNRTVELRGNSTDTVPPNVSINSPQGGQTFTSGTAMNIAFQATDNDKVAGYTITASIGGQTFNIASLGANATSVLWSIPELLGSASGTVTVTAIDTSGNRGSATSGIFQIQRAQSNAPFLRVLLTFDPPPAGQIAPPQNLRVSAVEFKPSIAPQQANPALTGYNVYRIVQPDPGQPLPSAEDIIKNGVLVGSAEASATSFTDTVSTSNASNFAYTVTSTFGSGQQSGGANPAATDLPVIRNPRYASGALLLDLAKSYIKQGATLSVDDTETYTLQVDSSGLQYIVPKSQKSTPGGKKIKQAIPANKTVLLKVKNPDGKISVGVQFKR